MYLRIILHANEHMGQLVACARMTGVVPLGQTGNSPLESLFPDALVASCSVTGVVWCLG